MVDKPSRITSELPHLGQRGVTVHAVERAGGIRAAVESQPVVGRDIVVQPRTHRLGPHNRNPEVLHVVVGAPKKARRRKCGGRVDRTFNPQKNPKKPPKKTKNMFGGAPPPKRAVQ